MACAARVKGRAVATVQSAPPLVAWAGIVSVQGSLWPAPALAAQLPNTPVLVDLSADHRFDPAWIYGLPERTRAQLHGARRIANPGCYATGIQLGIGPALHGHQQWQGRLAFTQVVADVLAQFLGVALVVEQVVHQLERRAQRPAVAGAGFLDTGQIGRAHV